MIIERYPEQIDLYYSVKDNNATQGELGSVKKNEAIEKFYARL